MDYRSILYQKEGGVAMITLNRPRALNALNTEMIEELLEAVWQAAEDKEVKVLLLTGAGRAFCFGAEISEFTKAQEHPAENSAGSLLLKIAENHSLAFWYAQADDCRAKRFCHRTGP